MKSSLALISSVALLTITSACGSNNQNGTYSSTGGTTATSQKMTVSLASPQMKSLGTITVQPNSAVTFNAVVSGSEGTLNYAWTHSGGVFVDGCSLSSPTCVVQYDNSDPETPYSVGLVAKDTYGQQGSATQTVNIGIITSSNSSKREVASVKDESNEMGSLFIGAGMLTIALAFAIWSFQSRKKKSSRSPE